MGAFDAPLFAVSAAEAAAMDPQERGLLETTYRAFENGKALPRPLVLQIDSDSA